MISVARASIKHISIKLSFVLIKYTLSLNLSLSTYSSRKIARMFRLSETGFHSHVYVYTDIATNYALSHMWIGLKL